MMRQKHIRWGDKNQYLGKTSTGTWVPWPSFANPIDTYYYGTNMSLDELAQYFDAEIIQNKGDSAIARPILKVSHGSLEITFYWSRTSEYSNLPDQFKNASEKYIFEVSDFSYKELRRSISNEK